MANKTKLEKTTASMERKLNKLKGQLKEAKAVYNQSDKKHSKINTSGLKYGKKTFKDYASARKFILNQTKNIEKRKEKIHEAKKLKQYKAKERKALEKLTKTKKGKEIVKEYKRAKKLSKNLEQSKGLKSQRINNFSQKNLKAYIKKVESYYEDVFRQLEIIFNKHHLGADFKNLIDQLWQVRNQLTPEDIDTLNRAIEQQYADEDTEEDFGIGQLMDTIQLVINKYYGEDEEDEELPSFA